MGKTPRVIIIGAGPAGLGAAWRLAELGLSNFTVYEGQTHAGGLASSITDTAGFTWDIGGHVIHSHYPYFDRMFEAVMRGAYTTRKRVSCVYMYERFIPFPLQNNIRHLPVRIRNECLRGLRKAASRVTPKAPESFGAWIRHTYGEGLARVFLLPFNRKLWVYPPERMGTQWMSDRVAPVDIETIEKNIRDKRDDASWGPNAVFTYPERGGNGNLWERVAFILRKHVRYGKHVAAIDAGKKTVTFADGTIDTYDTLFTTMPLDRLSGMIHHAALPSARGLVASSVSAVGIGIAGRLPKTLETMCWMYFPQRNIPFFRATVLSNYSPFNAPTGTWSLLAEITTNAAKPLPGVKTPERVIAAARSIGLIPKNARVVDTWMFQSRYGYPVPTRARDSIVDPLLAALAGYGIYSRGRFGMWKYEVSNQDHTFMQGVEWADSFKMG